MPTCVHACQCASLKWSIMLQASRILDMRFSFQLLSFFFLGTDMSRMCTASSSNMPSSRKNSTRGRTSVRHKPTYAAGVSLGKAILTVWFVPPHPLPWQAPLQGTNQCTVRGCHREWDTNSLDCPTTPSSSFSSMWHKPVYVFGVS